MDGLVLLQRGGVEGFRGMCFESCVSVSPGPTLGEKGLTIDMHRSFALYSAARSARARTKQHRNPRQGVPGWRCTALDA